VTFSGEIDTSASELEVDFTATSTLFPGWFEVSVESSGSETTFVLSGKHAANLQASDENLWAIMAPFVQYAPFRYRRSPSGIV
jgi:hypothetical protein